MTITLDDPPTDQTTASQRLQAEMAAARLSFKWLGVRKTLTADQKSQAADSFNAESKYLSASKKLLDTSHPLFKAVTAVKSKATSYWKSCSLPFPEPGLRLIKRSLIDDFDRQIATFQEELRDSVEHLDLHFLELRDAARERLGDLYDIADYPASLSDEFSITHEYPSVEPPSYLSQLSPDLYAAECRRMQARFDEAVELAEQTFTDELAKLVEHLTDRLAGNDDGKPKRFRDSVVGNLTEFFGRFRELNVGSSEQLDALVQQAQTAVQGVSADQLRDSEQLRRRVAGSMAAVQAGLDQMLVAKPRRNIQRRGR